MNSRADVSKPTYLSKEESFMYDREGRFKMEDTMNAARIEYTEKAVMNMASRRCDVLRLQGTGCCRDHGHAAGRGLVP